MDAVCGKNDWHLGQWVGVLDGPLILALPAFRFGSSSARLPPAVPK